MEEEETKCGDDSPQLQETGRLCLPPSTVQAQNYTVITKAYDTDVHLFPLVGCNRRGKRGEWRIFQKWPNILKTLYMWSSTQFQQLKPKPNLWLQKSMHNFSYYCMFIYIFFMLPVLHHTQDWLRSLWLWLVIITWFSLIPSPILLTMILCKLTLGEVFDCD